MRLHVNIDHVAPVGRVWLNIGHAIEARTRFVGPYRAVSDMLALVGE